ncbi:MAG: DNA/RNA non-specific endonuclease, partial [Hymenobacter sp.]
MIALFVRYVHRYFLRLTSAGLLLLATACSHSDTPAPAATATQDDNLALGNPSGGGLSTTTPNNYLLVRDQYTLSYNRDQGKPNWVRWHLSSAWLGSTARQDNFAADADLPSSWYQVKATD